MARYVETGREGERGVVLLVVLGLVALVASWASTAVYEDMVEIRRAENAQDGAQAWLGSESVMHLARKVLAEDANRSKSDDLNEAWAKETPSFPVDGGRLSGRIVDGNRYFNLNDLVDGKGVARPDAAAIARRLFARLGLDRGLVDVLVDWMDADNTPSGAAGAEDASYYDKPYRVKNARLDRWSELRLLKGFDKKAVAALAAVAMVAPVPASGMTPINVNTASKEVLLALFPRMSDVEAESLIAARPYREMKDVIAQSWAQGVDPARLSVSSNLFMVQTDAEFGRAGMREEYVLMRQGAQLTLLSRSRLIAGAGR